MSEAPTVERKATMVPPVVLPPDFPLPESGRIYTYEEVVAEFPETKQPCELGEGELVFMAAPSFYHQEIALCFYRNLFAWVKLGRLGKVVVSPVDMVLSPHRVRQPDVAFLARERLHIVGKVINGPVDLAVEVTSLDADGRWRDRIDKRDLYEQYGIKEYWMIDPEAKTVEVLWLQSGTYVLHGRFGTGMTAGSRLLDGFSISVDALFTE